MNSQLFHIFDEKSIVEDCDHEPGDLKFCKNCFKLSIANKKQDNQICACLPMIHALRRFMENACNVDNYRIVPPANKIAYTMVLSEKEFDCCKLNMDTPIGFLTMKKIVEKKLNRKRIYVKWNIEEYLIAITAVPFDQ